MHTIPIELAQARMKRSEIWAEYMQVIEREHTPAEFHAALTKAGRADIECNLWYDRWQKLGGTSNIESIVETETFLNEMKQTEAEVAPWDEIPDWQTRAEIEMEWARDEQATREAVRP